MNILQNNLKIFNVNIVEFFHYIKIKETKEKNLNKYITNCKKLFLF